MYLCHSSRCVCVLVLSEAKRFKHVSLSVSMNIGSAPKSLMRLLRGVLAAPPSIMYARSQLPKRFFIISKIVRCTSNTFCFNAVGLSYRSPPVKHCHMLSMSQTISLLPFMLFTNVVLPEHARRKRNTPCAPSHTRSVCVFHYALYAKQALCFRDLTKRNNR